jgi:hypothetical protein
MLGGMKTPIALVLALLCAVLASTASAATIVAREIEETAGHLQYSWKLEVIEDDRGGRWIFTKSVFDSAKLASVAFAQSHIATVDLYTLRALAEKAREWDTSCEAGKPEGFEKDLPAAPRMKGRFHWITGTTTPLSMTMVDSTDHMMACWWSRKDLDAYIALCDAAKINEMVAELRTKADGAKDFAKTLK